MAICRAQTVAARPRSHPACSVDDWAGEPPPKVTGAQYKEALQEAKDFKYAARPIPGTESEEFKAAERRRVEAQKAKEAGVKPREETAEETMRRLGLKAAS
jgi:hypothetical protein